MAINKNAFIRYQALNKCFRNNGRKYFIEDLLEVCNNSLSEIEGRGVTIQKRQLFEDIKFMESEQGWSIPLERFREGKKIFYAYSDRKFSINNQPLNESETNHLKSALMILSKFKGMPQFEWVSEITTKIYSSLELEAGTSKIISFDSNEYLKGIDFLGEIFNAIHYKRVLNMKYKPFKSEIVYDYEIHPYHLKQFNNRWFLFAFNKGLGKISNLALDRVISLKEVNKKYIPNTLIDFDEYFDDIIGVTKPEGAQEMQIELLFSNEEAPYILTKPIHGSQKKIKHDNSGLLITIDVIHNPELEKLLLSFGEKVAVLKPLSLKNRLKKRYTEAVNQYL